jgi:CheY-like chemotaxis protein
MIYLIDDKRNRQMDYGWTDEKFDKYSNILCAIYEYDAIHALELRNKIFSPTNTILFHESFFDTNVNTHKKSTLSIRDSLIRYASENPSSNVVFFSGSKSSRKIDENVAHIPVSILYQYLEVFIERVSNNDVDLRYLLFGAKFEIEESLQKKLEEANSNFNDFSDEEPISKIFIALTIENEIDLVFDNAVYKTFYLDEKHNFDVTDEYLSEIIIDWFNGEEYDSIFIPLCFGPVLSDYNGLRFATHIRCTETLNRLKNIFIYSFVDYADIIQNEYFDILKSKNVRLIEYKSSSFFKASLLNCEALSCDELPVEINKVKLDPPKNYEDNHSISNEWAIYRWAVSINAYTPDINRVLNNVNNQLYFKVLKTIYPPADIIRLSEHQLKINYEGAPKILYIDDEANKGWYEILSNLFSNINKLEFDYLDDEFNSKIQEEIISTSIDKIKSENIDMVILDFRLHPNDFSTDDFSTITGLRLLKEIKKINPGIQVVIFSATNKTWNFQDLQMNGADGFVLKESPEFSLNPKVTSLLIQKMLLTIEGCLAKTFLKDFFDCYKILKDELIPRKNYKRTDKPLPKEFVDEALKWLEISYQQLNSGISQSSLTSSFLFMFSVLENISNRVINIENPIPTKQEGLFHYEFRGSEQKLKLFIEDKDNLGYYRKTKSHLSSKRNVSWVMKILNTLDFISNEQYSIHELSNLIKLRNDVIHANSNSGDVILTEKNSIEFLNKLIYNGLKNIK